MIGIVILNYMAWQQTLSCVESVRRACRAAFQVYIVDNASPNGSLEHLRGEFQGVADVVVIENDANRGYNGGNNVGLGRALSDGCQICIVANSDILFGNGSIDSLAMFLGECPEAGIVGPKVLDRKGSVVRSVMCRRTGLREKYLVRSPLRWLAPRDLARAYFGRAKDWSQSFEVFAVSGCCFAMTRSAAMRLLPFDENTFLYEEEPILGIRAAEAAIATFYCPQAEVTHEHAASVRLAGASTWIHAVCSEIYYCQTYLRTGRLRIIPLYLLRTASFFWSALWNPSYLKCVPAYLSATIGRLRSADGLG